jgi:hypothetical protein
MAGRPRKTAAVVQIPGAAPAADAPEIDPTAAAPISDSDIQVNGMWLSHNDGSLRHANASLGAKAEARAKFTDADIDPTAIRQPVMTPDGWLCPEPKPVG